ncbi:MAG TPA: type I DNA topoisomerase [Bdellovibrionales bacterium]|nr:MAG: DNA topoisomerase I [Bdellovibrionales bacterium GWB1_52_6]OFZ04756.1 MAG: DNA topoisomerase I [Bdellovibrionales bacterium GWA1_52_35]OFZ38169.1 MAG: DNA topoisomerase I [Bdellovibrionales bacterium GWC1_52_8]HAR44380.1 type I DNA topoisomerase [Bdellovibrionales bacterium]HCM39570.1 type I DNA topoisomerase [Bdellovibrionales bacterium]
MAKKALVIVESPSKAKTIQKYLGREYIVKASVGHIKDLPKSKLGVDPDKGFDPDYQLIPSKVKVIAELKKASEKVPELFLATDPDREGEAIAWHINEELKTRGKKVHRVLFNSVTKQAILEAMSKPLKLNTDLYHAQQARRILDRLVGYKISPLLWDKVRRGISAGRVQSVALRIVVDREAEIKAFKPDEYWNVEGVFLKDGVDFNARLFKINGKDPELPNQQIINELMAGIKSTPWKIGNVEQKERSRKPTPPFITSRLQQDAARKLGFSAKKTMALAQHLYEGVDLGELGTHGLITYMRTDSVRVEPGALQSVREYIAKTYGKDHLPAEANVYKSKKSAQDAHEAIRPATLEFPPDRIEKLLERDEFRLFQLIWNRFVASQMTPAVYDQTTIDVVGKASDGRDITFRATGSVMKEPGYTAVYAEEEDDKSEEGGMGSLRIKSAKEGEKVTSKELTPSQHFTQPPPRYTDASLIRDLEEKGIGRPSTYATILSNLQDREYVEKREQRYYPSELGTVVTDLLVASFPDVLNSEFTAEMENKLDDIEEGKSDWKKVLSQFWKPFAKTLEKAKKTMKDVKRQEVPTTIKCDKCSHIMVIKWGKLGSFLACSNYPECKNTQDFKKDDQGNIVIVPKEFTDKSCEKCSKPMVVKGGKYGKFLACSDYPNCKFTAAITLGIPCPVCKEGEIAQKQSRYGRVFYSCNKWPKCNFAIWDKPRTEPCPACKFPIISEKITKRAGLMYKCTQKECGWSEIIDPNAGKAPPPDERDEEQQKTAETVKSA